MKGTHENPARISNWFVMGCGFAGEVRNHPRQATFAKPLQLAYPQEPDLSGFNPGDTFVTDRGTHFVLGERK